MLDILFKSAAQLFDPASWFVTLKALILSVAVMGALIWGGLWAGESYLGTGWSWIDWIIEHVIDFSVWLVALLVFPAVITMTVGLFLDDIAAAVERRYYPQDPPGRPLGIGRALLVAVRLGLLILLVNLLALPFYIAFFFMPFVSLALYYVVNGFLLSREYMELAGLRHLDGKSVRSLRRKNRGYVFLAGCLIAFLFTVPGVNLIAPIIGAAFMVHVFKTLSHREAPAIA